VEVAQGIGPEFNPLNCKKKKKKKISKLYTHTHTHFFKKRAFDKAEHIVQRRAA
jgi:N-acetylglutamate synthase-like GNAT family acetyltransferase